MSDSNQDLTNLLEITRALSVHQTSAIDAATRTSQSGPVEGLAQMAGSTSNTLSLLTALEMSSGEAWHKSVPEELSGPLNAQLLRSARTTLALADAAGVGAEGAALGAARGLIEALPAEWRLWATQDASKMSASWQNELGDIRNKALLEMGQEPAVAPRVSGPEPAPQDISVASFGHTPEETVVNPVNSFANMFVMDNLRFFHALGGQAWPGQPQPLVVDGKFQEGERKEIDFSEMQRRSRDILVEVKRREVQSGKSFDEQRQEMPRFYQTMLDIEASNATMALSLHAQAFDKPPTGPSVGAMKGLLSLMSHEAKSDLVTRGVFMPTTEWGHESAKAQKEVEFGAKLGALRQASALAAPVAGDVVVNRVDIEVPTLTVSDIVPSGVEIAKPAAARVEPTLAGDAPKSMMAFIDQREAAIQAPARHSGWLARDAAPPQAIEPEEQAPAPAPIDYEGLGFKAGRMLSGFVNEWSPSAIGQKISAAYAGARQRAEGAILGLNASVDRAAGFVSAPLMGAKELAGQKTAAVKEGVGEWAHDKAEKLAGWADEKLEKAVGLVGVVGELSHAGVANAKALAGDAALRVKNRLPSEEAIVASAEKQKKAVKWASIGGAMLVGVAMAPVAGVVFAAVGGWAAYAGFDKGLAAGAQKFSAVAGALPEKLDNLADRLGARRSQLEKKEPKMEASAPKM